MRALTQVAARQFASVGITVNVYCPGVVGTDMWVEIDRRMAEITGARIGENYEKFVGGIALVSGALLGGLLLQFFSTLGENFTLLASALFLGPLITNFALIAPGLIGILLSRNPDGLVADLLTFAHPGDQSLEWTDLVELLREAALYVRPEFADLDIACAEAIDKRVPELCVDREKLFQAFLNVLRNAYQATPAGGTVTLRAALQGSDHVSLAVHNTGSYIPAEVRVRLFHPFFTTKREGTGLGLPISHHIVRAHGGEIRVISEPEMGTTFEIVLPAVRVGA